MPIDFDKLLTGDPIDALIEPRKIFATLSNKAQKYSYLRDVQSEVLDAWFARRDEPDLVVAAIRQMVKAQRNK